MGFTYLIISNEMLSRYKNSNVVLLYQYFVENYRFIEDEIWFDDKRFIHISMKELKDNLYLSDKILRKCFNILKNDSKIEIKKFGIPSKNYYNIPYCNNDKFKGGY